MDESFCISSQTLTEELLIRYPECCEVFEKHGMPCRECMGVECETLSDSALMHGIDIDILIKELKECLECNEPPSC